MKMIANTLDHICADQNIVTSYCEITLGNDYESKGSFHFLHPICVDSKPYMCSTFRSDPSICGFHFWHNTNNKNIE